MQFNGKMCNMEFKLLISSEYDKKVNVLFFNFLKCSSAF